MQLLGIHIFRLLPALTRARSDPLHALHFACHVAATYRQVEQETAQGVPGIGSGAAARALGASIVYGFVQIRDGCLWRGCQRAESVRVYEYGVPRSGKKSN
jgi:hypothetical protein